MDVSPRTLYDVYVKPWRDFAAVGGRGLMVSHPSLNAVPMHANTAILNGTLRGMLGLEEAIFGSDNENVRWLSDSFNYAANESDSAVRVRGCCVLRIRILLTPTPLLLTHSLTQAILAGVDQEMDGFSRSLYLRYLPDAVASGAVPMSVLDRAAGNVLRYKFAAGLFDSPPVRDPELPSTHCRTPAARALQVRTAAVTHPPLPMI